MFPQWTACHRSALLRICVAALLAVVTGSVFGDDAVLNDGDDARERLVLLKSGRMMTGQVSRNAGGYLIEQTNGRIQVPADEVKFVVNDLREAYLKQRDHVIEPTPATHLSLAEWCISYRLHEEARIELQKCLKRDPENNEARKLLQRLTDTIRDGLPRVADSPPVRKTADGFLQPDAESLGGLSKDLAVQFTSRIQVLLINKCGNASCHGAESSNAFKITSARVSGRGSRQNSERNLAETLRWIDTDNVAKSKLLAALQGTHGNRGPIFVGSAAAEQTKVLRTWVRAVADEKRAEARQLEQLADVTTSTRPKKRVVQVSAKRRMSANTASRDATPVQEEMDEPAAENADLDAPEPEEENTDPNESAADSTDAKALAQKPSDAFDPERFNRRFSPR